MQLSLLFTLAPTHVSNSRLQLTILPPLPSSLPSPGSVAFAGQVSLRAATPIPHPLSWHVSLHASISINTGTALAFQWEYHVFQSCVRRRFDLVVLVISFLVFVSYACVCVPPWSRSQATLQVTAVYLTVSTYCTLVSVFKMSDIGCPDYEAHKACLCGGQRCQMTQSNKPESSRITSS